MGKDFETRHDLTVDATPEQVWQAIATGPGISSWFIGRTDVDGDTVRTSFGDGWMPTGIITAHDRPHHFAHRSDPTPDGRYIANEYLIEGRDRSTTTLRAVTSGFLPGDDWADEYEAMRYGTELFFATLVAYLRHFPGRTATPVTAFGPPVTDWPATWHNLHTALGLTAGFQAGDPLPGGGHVYFTNPHTLGLHTDRGLYRYLRGFHGSLVAGHELFAPDDTDWNAFLAKL
jgi:uncharacterized protein YndB with AHSA1/START domain